MNFDPSEEQRLFAASIERFVARDYTFETRRHVVASHDGYSRDVWAALADLGLLADRGTEDRAKPANDESQPAAAAELLQSLFRAQFAGRVWALGLQLGDGATLIDDGLLCPVHARRREEQQFAACGRKRQVDAGVRSFGARRSL